MGMERIQWHEWSAEAFERARKEDKLILLDIGAVWCHWCHVMDEESYANPEIIELVNAHYVPIRVDNDERPDVNDRYNQGGWPTTVILTPEGFVVHGATYLPPATVKELLIEAREWYRENRDRVDRAAEEIAKKMAEQPQFPPVREEEPKDFSGAIVQDIKNNADPLHGGFGTTQKFPQPGAISLAFAHHHATGDEAILDFAELTLRNMSEGLLDKEEGGLFRYSVTREWDVPHFEKNLDVNAQCLRNYLDAYRITGKREYAEAAERIIGYVFGTLADREHGGFYGSQDADIYDEHQMKIVMTGEEYYRLPLEERRKHGTPYIDRTVFTNWNALMVSSFLDAYHVLEREDCRDFALRTLKLLTEKCRDEKGVAVHYLRNGTAGGPALLGDSVALARASLDAYEATGDNRHLGEAERLMKLAVEHLGAEDGGFYDSMFDESLPPATRIRHKPLNENALAAEVLGRLYNYTTKREYLKLGTATVLAFEGNVLAMLERSLGYFAADMALASRYVVDSSVKVSIVGSSEDLRSREMLRVSKRVYHPAKIVQLLDPAEDMLLIEAMRYRPEETPVAHVCTAKGCLSPIREVEELRSLLAASA
ncbi:MAG: thioredoxin domain-containing protein [Candidatus Abyssubacteria bacterium]